MKEVKFIEQNKKKWQRFETLSKSSSADPDEVSKLFVEITDDLSYAQTHYPKRTVRVYLNQLAQGVFMNVYKARKTVKSRLITFWTQDLPLEMYRARKILLFNFIFILLATAIGAISTHNDHDFPRIILGDAYVDMTDEYIEQGDPMKVYSTSGEEFMFARIAQNNIRVALTAFAFGILFSVGTLIFMLFNGVMLGAFIYYFKVKGVFVVAQSAIWLHGAFEISSIVIAGAAGIVIGNSLLFPKTYTRGQSMIIGGKRGIKIIIGTIPFIIVAAFIESYVTRLYLEMPDWKNWTIIGVSMLIMILYFVVYPYIKFRGTDEDSLDGEPVYKKPALMDKWKVRKVSETFTATFTWYRSIFLNIGGAIVMNTLLHLAALVTYAVAFSQDSFSGLFYSWRELAHVIAGTTNNPDWILMSIHIVFMSISMCLFWSGFKMTESEDVKPWPFVLKNVWKLIPFACIPFIVFTYTPVGIQVLLLFLLPALAFIMFSISQNENPSKAISLSFKKLMDSIVIFLVFTVFLIMLHYFMYPVIIGDYEVFQSNGVYQQIQELLAWHFIPLMDDPYLALNVVDGILYVAIAQFVIPLFYIAFALQYYSNREHVEAVGLRMKLEQFGKENKVYETYDEDDTI